MLQKVTFFESSGIDGSPERIKAYSKGLSLVRDILEWHRLRGWRQVEWVKSPDISILKRNLAGERILEEALDSCRRVEVRFSILGDSNNLIVQIKVFSRAKTVLLDISGVLTPERFGDTKLEIASFRYFRDE